MAITANDLNLSIAVLVGSFGIITTLIAYIWNSMLKATNVKIDDQHKLIKELSDISRNLEIMVRVHDVEIESIKKAS
jgi:hypothetical protein